MSKLARTACFARVVAVASVVSLGGAVAWSAAPGRIEAIVRVRLLAMDDAGGVTEDATVILEDGVVRRVGPASEVAIPEQAIVLEGLGRTLLPGLVDAHVHLDGGGAPRFDRDPEAAARAALRHGVTAVLDLNCAEPVIFGLRAIEQADATALLPHIFAAGSAISLPGGHGTQGGYPARLLASGDDPGPAVLELADLRADWLKIMVDGGGYGGEPQRPTLTEGDVARIIAAAHARGLRVAVHAIAVDRARAAVVAGADLLAHVPFEGPFDESFLALLVERGTVVVPTLATYAAQATLAAKPAADARERIRGEYFARRLPEIREIVSRMHRAGVRLVPGSDAGMPGVFHGAALHSELAEFERAGVPVAVVLQRATRDAAEWVLNARSLGRVVPGEPANLLLVDGNPLLRLGDLARVVAVWKRGVRVPAAILAAPGTDGAPVPFNERLRLVDFEGSAPPLLHVDTAFVVHGTSPSRDTDEECVGSIVAESDGEPAGRLLRITGRRSGNDPLALADGIALDLTTSLPADSLTRYRALRFRVRGAGVERCRVALLSRAVRDSDHHGRTFAVDAAFAVVELPFDEFTQVGFGDRRRLDLGAVFAIAFQPQVEGRVEFALDVDDLELVR